MKIATDEPKPDPALVRRVRVIGVLIMLASAVLVARLWELQIADGEYYESRSTQQRLRPLQLKASRGIIYGRNDVILADNRAACDIVVIPGDCGEEAPQVAEHLERLLRIDGAKLLEQIEFKRRRDPFEQLVVKEDVSKTEILRVEAAAAQLPGVMTVVQPRRRYHFGRTGGQVLGYLGAISEDEWRQNRSRYAFNDVIGRSGIERYYEDVLKGQHGRILVNVYSSGLPQLRTDEFGRPVVAPDSKGRQLREEEAYRRDPEPGGDIRLTLDIELQQMAEELLESDPEIIEGAIVVLNANTGAVLALASVPRYDPGAFVTPSRQDERNMALFGELKPAVNRCVQEHYHPGSVFKIIVAAGALEEGLVNSQTAFSCGGAFHRWGMRFGCWSHGHGSVSLERALSESCDVYFYNLGLLLDVDGIHKWATRFGLGQPTGIDLPSEQAGIVPSRDWKREWGQRFHPDDPSEWRWYPAETPSVAIGQGALTTTPLQNAVMMAAVVNGGRLVRPYLDEARGPLVSEPIMSNRTVELIRQGLERCVEDNTPPRGTGWRARVPGITMLGKTGTAQRVPLAAIRQYGSEKSKIPYQLRHDAWFVAGVMDEELPIAICILIEHGHSGGEFASPLAKPLVEFFYSKERPDEYPLLAQRTNP